MKAIVINSCMPPAELTIRGGIFHAPPIDQGNTSRLFSQCHGNTGNAVIGYSVCTILRESGCEIALNIGSLDELSLKWDRFEQMILQAPLVFLCLQDLLRPDAIEIWSPQQLELIVRLCQSASCRLCVLSLGSNHLEDITAPGDLVLTSILPREVIQVLDAIIEHSMALQVRTEGLRLAIDLAYPRKSINWLHPGCPSYYRKDINKDRLMRNLSDIKTWRECGRKVLGGGLFGFKTSELFARTAYIPQSFSELLLSNRLYVGDPAFSYPYNSTAVTAALATASIVTFIGARAWQDHLSREDFLWYTGTRLHGGIMALLEGIPAVFTGGDKRTKDFTDHFLLPWHTGILLEDAPQIISNWDWEATMAAQREEKNAFWKQIKRLINT
jgi:hypothetical protein